MRKLFFTAFLFLALSAFGQRAFHDVNFSAGARMSSKTIGTGGMLEFQFHPAIDSMYHFFAVGAGAEYSSQEKWMLDTKFTVGLGQNYICHVIWGEYYPTWFAAIHFRNKPDMSKANVALEAGRNLRLSEMWFVVPSVRYDFISPQEGYDWKSNAFVCLNVRMLLFYRHGLWISRPEGKNAKATF